MDIDLVFDNGTVTVKKSSDSSTLYSILGTSVVSVAAVEQENVDDLGPFAVVNTSSGFYHKLYIERIQSPETYGTAAHLVDALNTAFQL